MDSLKNSWLTEGLIDFEYKKYVLLAYLKNVKDSFNEVKLYPYLADLIFHYRNLLALRENKSLINNAFPKQLSIEDIKKLELNYQKMIDDDAVMKEIESIIEFSLPQMKSSLDEGAFIYEYVESKCEISPVGLTSLYTHEGYLFVSQPPERETNIYRYQITIFDNSNEPLRGIHTEYIRTAEKSLSNSYENLKLGLLRQYTELPNPSTYVVVAKLNFPLQQTLMPVAKRLLVKQIASGED